MVSTNGPFGVQLLSICLLIKAKSVLCVNKLIGYVILSWNALCYHGMRHTMYNLEMRRNIWKWVILPGYGSYIVLPGDVILPANG